MSLQQQLRKMWKQIKKWWLINPSHSILPDETWKYIQKQHVEQIKKDLQSIIVVQDKKTITLTQAHKMQILVYMRQYVHILYRYLRLYKIPIRKKIAELITTDEIEWLCKSYDTITLAKLQMNEEEAFIYLKELMLIHSTAILQDYTQVLGTILLLYSSLQIFKNTIITDSYLSDILHSSLAILDEAIRFAISEQLLPAQCANKIKLTLN